MKKFALLMLLATGACASPVAPSEPAPTGLFAQPKNVLCWCAVDVNGSNPRSVATRCGPNHQTGEWTPICGKTAEPNPNPGR